MKSWKIDYRSISFSLYCLLSLIITITHEPFKNEAQAWLIVRDLDLSGIFNMMWYEGTPALWHLLIFPLVKLGMPYFSMQLLHWLFAVAIAWLLIYKSTFPPVFKVLLVFSYYFLYEYCAMARNYNITILLMFLLATIWKRKGELPLLFCLLVILLINSNLVIWGFGVAVTLLYFYDCKCNRKHLKLSHFLTIIILLAGFALVLFQIIPRGSAADHSVVHFSFWDIKFPEMIFRAPANALVTVDGGSDSMVIPFFFLFTYLAIALLLIKRTRILLAALISSAWCLYMFTFIYMGDTRHHGFLLMILIFFFWVITLYPKSEWYKKFLPPYFTSEAFKNGVFLIIGLCLLTSVVRTLVIIPKEIRYSFSGSREIAHYIKDNDLENLTWIGFQSEKCEAILPYFPEKKFWYAGLQDYGSYIIWDTEFKENHNISEEEIITRINKHFPGQKDILLVMSKPLATPSIDGFRQLYQNKREVFWIQDETYYLYVPVSDS
ncbi:MAG: hypothetical protein K9N06_06785 [Candidatus Cloacimonetes bacterium]|nr:hypothetical protein [Candidatus Cloacimonadota bacterium]